MKKSNKYIIGIVVGVAILIGIFIAYRYGLFSRKEGYKRAPLGSETASVQRTPVDFQNNWKSNPHYISEPSSKYQPLEYQSPIDFYKDERKIADGTIFKQYMGDWQGVGKDLDNLRNDEKNRKDILDMGYTDAFRVLSNSYNQSFGPKLNMNNEMGRIKPNTNFGPLYGGKNYLVHDKIGN